MFTPADTALLGTLAHDHCKEVEESGFDPKWMEHPVAQAVAEATIAVHRRSKTINSFNVLAQARNIPKEFVPHLIQIYQNGYGDVDPVAAVKSVKRAYMARSALKTAREVSDLATNKPDDVEQWLVDKTREMASVLRSGETYSSKPSDHSDKSVLEKIYDTGIHGMGDVLRGGPLKTQFIVLAGLTKHGKTTTMISVAIDALLHKRKVSFVATENSTSIAISNIIRGQRRQLRLHCSRQSQMSHPIRFSWRF